MRIERHHRGDRQRGDGRDRHPQHATGAAGLRPVCVLPGEENQPGRMVESGATEQLFSNPFDQRTSDYVNGNSAERPLRFVQRWNVQLEACRRGDRHLGGGVDRPHPDDRGGTGHGWRVAAVHGLKLRQRGHPASGWVSHRRSTGSTSTGRCAPRSSASTPSPRIRSTSRVRPPLRREASRRTTRRSRTSTCPTWAVGSASCTTCTALTASGSPAWS